MRVPMAFLLKPDNYPSVRSLFGEMTCHLAAQVVLVGILPGRIYFSNLALLSAIFKKRQPKSCLLGFVLVYSWIGNLRVAYIKTGAKCAT
jgi:hypothetical protein